MCVCLTQYISLVIEIYTFSRVITSAKRIRSLCIVNKKESGSSSSSDSEFGEEEQLMSQPQLIARYSAEHEVIIATRNSMNLTFELCTFL